MARTSEESTSATKKGGPRPPFCLSLIDLLDDGSLARFNHVGPVVAFEIAILAQRRRLPMDLIGEGSDLHGFRQALADPNAGGRDAPGGPLFYAAGPRVLADDLPIFVGECHLALCRGYRSSRLR